MADGTLKLEDNLNAYYNALNSAVGGVTTSLATIKSLRRSLDSMKWSGESRNHFIALLDIIIQYHEDMEKIGEELKDNLELLQDKVDQYHTYLTVKELEGIR